VSISLGTALQKLGRTIPADLSVVVFDQAPGLETLLGVSPTHVAQPLFEMGRRAAALARDLKEGKDVPPETALPCRVVEGQSVQSLE